VGIHVVAQPRALRAAGEVLVRRTVGHGIATNALALLSPSSQVDQRGNTQALPQLLHHHGKLLRRNRKIAEGSAMKGKQAVAAESIPPRWQTSCV